MPEGVEVLIQVEGLQDAIVGEEIEKITFGDRGYKIIRPATEKLFSYILTGVTIQKVSRVGKYIVFHLSNDKYLVTHLRMTGRYTVDVDEDLIGHTRLTFHLKSGKELRYSDVRLFGRVMLLNELSSLEKGLDVLSCSGDDLIERLSDISTHKKHRKKNVKEILTSQDLLTGVGNVYANETLLRASLFPGTRMEELTKKEISKLATAIKSTMLWGYRLGGLSMKDYFHVDGSQGKAQDLLSIYKRPNCHRCSSKVYRSEKFDGRATYYCYKCCPPKGEEDDET